MKFARWARIVLAVLLLGGAVAVADEVTDPEPAYAFTCPTGTKPQVCAQLQVVEVTLRALGLSGSPLEQAVHGVLEVANDYPTAPACENARIAAAIPEDCPEEFLMQQAASVAEVIVSLATTELAYATNPQLRKFMCQFFPGLINESWCLPEPDNDAFAGLPGGSNYTGTASLMTRPTAYRGTHLGPGYTVVYSIDLGVSSRFMRWGQSATSSTRYHQATLAVAGTGLATWTLAGMAPSWTSPPFPLEVGERSAIAIRQQDSGNLGEYDIVWVDGEGEVYTYVHDPIDHTEGWMYQGLDPGFAYHSAVHGSAYPGTWAQNYASTTVTALVEKFGRFDPGSPLPAIEVPVPPDEGPFPEAPPAEPVPAPEVDPPPSSIPAPPTPTEVPSAPDNEEGDSVGTLESLGDRIGGFFDNLAGMIGGAFGWLGDLFWDAIRWLVDRLWEMFSWLGDLLQQLVGWIVDAIEALGSLLAGLLNLIYQALQTIVAILSSLLGQVISLLGSILSTIGSLLGSIISTLLNLPQLIWNLFLSGLQFLFIPSGPPDLPTCSATFPCSWVAEGGTALGALADLVDPGACTAPVIGFDFPAPVDRFEITAPVPSGCSGTVVAGAEPVGDLWGYRAPVRALMSFFLWAAVIAMFIRQAPWSTGDETPLDGLGHVEAS